METGPVGVKSQHTGNSTGRWKEWKATWQKVTEKERDCENIWPSYVFCCAFPSVSGLKSWEALVQMLGTKQGQRKFLLNEETELKRWSLSGGWACSLPGYQTVVAAPEHLPLRWRQPPRPHSSAANSTPAGFTVYRGPAPSLAQLPKQEHSSVYNLGTQSRSRSTDSVCFTPTHGRKLGY